jgi:chromosome segregation ATPase
MSDADKTTIRTRAYPGKAEDFVPQSNLTKEQSYALELVKKTAQLEEEKKKSLEYQKSIEQLRETLKQEQAKTAEMTKKMAGLEAKEKEFSELEAKVRELNEVLKKISGIAAAGKSG